MKAMRRFSALFLFAACLLSASEYQAQYQDGQAARAVIGQPGFSARDKGLVPRALSLARGNLYVAEAGHVTAFDVSRIGAVKTAACPVCLLTPQSITAQTVFEGAAAAGVYGRTVVIADSKGRRVLIWRTASQKPDVVLSGFVNPVSVAIDNQRLFVGDAGSHHVFVWNSLPASDGQAPDASLGVPETADTLGADTIETPSALVSDGVTLYVADSALRRVLVFSPAESAMPLVTNAATLTAGPLAPGTLAAIDRVPGVSSSVLLNGSAVRITEVNGEQIQFQVPYELNGALSGSLVVKSESPDGSILTTRPAAVRFVPASPGIFAFGIKEPRTGLVLHAPDGFPLSPESPAKAGELLSVWATGLGTVTVDANSEGAFDTLIPVRAMLNGNSVEVLSAVLPAEATGIYEVRLRLPNQISDGASLVLLQNDAKSNVITFPVRANHK